MDTTDSAIGRTCDPLWYGPPPVSRPADRCEPWPIDDQAAAPLAAAAADLGVAFELAAVITVERSLLGEELLSLGFVDPPPLLDAAARIAAVTRQLSEPVSAYLGALSRSTGPRRHPRGFLVLPMRLTERLLSSDPASRLDPILLPSAVAWERAAVLSGRSMTEWAMAVLVGRSG